MITYILYNFEEAINQEEIINLTSKRLRRHKNRQIQT
jgi:hypothetical protein